MSGVCAVTGTLNADPVDVKKQEIPSPSAAQPRVSAEATPANTRGVNKGPEIFYRGVGGEAVNDDCADAIPVAIPSTTFGTTTTATFDNNTFFCGTSTTAPGVWYSVVGNGNILRADTCGFRTYDTKITVYTGDCVNLLCVGGNDDSCGLGSAVQWQSVMGETYLIHVHGFSSGVGDFDLNVSEFLPCDITCDPNAVPEGEPDCFDFYVDSTNGGCNSPGNPTTPIVVNGDPVCGTAGTYLGLFDNNTPTNPNDDFVTNFRDTDWFFFSLTQPTTVTMTVNAEFNSLVGFINGSCPATSFISSAFGTECTPTTVVASLQPGNYFAFVAPSSFVGVACGSEYQVALTGVPFQPPSNDTCDQAIAVAIDSFTMGSTAGTNIDNGLPTCGTSISGPGVWFTVVGDGTTLTAETCGFRTYDTKINVFCGDCDNFEFFCVGGNDDACGLGSRVTWCSEAGTTYYILVQGFGGQSGDFELAVLSNGIGCSTPPPCAPCDITPMGTPEGEPNCFDFYVDATNGGCNSTPNVFGAIACGETVTGTAGTFLGLFDNNTPTNPNDDFVTNFRDTDWFLFTINEPQRVRVTATAEFPVLTGVVNLNNCFSPSFAFFTTANECLPAVASGLLQPGTYAVFVAPSVFSGVPCGREYNVMLECEDVVLPPNDFCEDAIHIGVGVTSGTTSGTTFDAAPFCGTSNTAPGVWYRVTGTGNTMTAETCGFRTYDTKISVYCGDCTNLICIGGNDDACGLGSRVTWCSEAGADYLILVHGFSSAVGDFDLFILDNGISCGGAIDCPDSGTPCQADLSGSSDPNDPAYGVPDGQVDASDFFYFLDQFVAGNLAVADLSGSSDPNDPGYGVPDGVIDASDFFYFLDIFVAGCP
ncbi:MAG: hypothetical protein KF866_06590 [Phycisphaeraceae bacterium]|nr:hypothetical protein [Phycisphaeraceae bacterium]